MIPSKEKLILIKKGVNQLDDFYFSIFLLNKTKKMSCFGYKNLLLQQLTRHIQERIKSSVVLF